MTSIGRMENLSVASTSFSVTAISWCYMMTSECGTPNTLEAPFAALRLEFIPRDNFHPYVTSPAFFNRNDLLGVFE